MALKSKNPISKSEANMGGTRRGMVWTPRVTKSARKVNRVGGRAMVSNMSTMESKIKV